VLKFLFYFLCEEVREGEGRERGEGGAGSGGGGGMRCICAVYPDSRATRSASTKVF
jgi:hypothetical protein